MLPLGQHLALASPWWSWDCQVVRKALWASVLTRVRRLGNERLKVNGAAGRSPSSWRDVEFLRREVKTHRRVFDGKTNLCPELLLGYASVLGIDTQDCFPTTETWIAEAAVYLSLYAESRVRAVSLEDAEVYVTHVAPLTVGGMRTCAEVEESLARMSVEIRVVVLSVASALAPVLMVSDPEGKPTAGGNGG
jgi:hypothetical protein